MYGMCEELAVGHILLVIYHFDKRILTNTYKSFHRNNDR